MISLQQTLFSIVKNWKHLPKMRNKTRVSTFTTGQSQCAQNYVRERKTNWNKVVVVRWLSLKRKIQLALTSSSDTPTFPLIRPLHLLSPLTGHSILAFFLVAFVTIWDHTQNPAMSLTPVSLSSSRTHHCFILSFLNCVPTTPSHHWILFLLL